MKSILFNHLKPQHYYLHLFGIFFILSLILSLTLSNFTNIFYIDLDLLLLKFIVIFFLLMTISVSIESFNKSEYMSPIEIYNLEFFFRNFLKDLRLKNNFDEFIFEDYFNKYDNRTKNKLVIFLKKFKRRFYISSIKKNSKGIYEIIFIDEYTLFRYFFIRFFAKHGIHKATLKEFKNTYKIIKLD